jgi:hypothetical protein
MAAHEFLLELKRRKVYRAALVYAGVGWVLLEFADVAFPRLGLPDWTVNLVLALILFGFPLAIVFAWIFDLNTQGIVRTEPISPEVHHRFSITSIIEFVLICRKSLDTIAKIIQKNRRIKEHKTSLQFV